MACLRNVLVSHSQFQSMIFSLDAWMKHAIIGLLFKCGNTFFGWFIYLCKKKLAYFLLNETSKPLGSQGFLLVNLDLTYVEQRGNNNLKVILYSDKSHSKLPFDTKYVEVFICILWKIESYTWSDMSVILFWCIIDALSSTFGNVW